MDYSNNITQSPTFCPAPWTCVNINQLGLVLPCLNSGFLLGNVKQRNFADILRDEPLRSMKQAQIQGQWHPGCSECKEREQYGHSPRTQWHVEPETIAAISQDLENYFVPEHVTINWSNLCNLACTYCNDETSTAWQSLRKIPIQHVKNEHDALISIISQHGHLLKGLSLGGGEPLLQKGLADLLEKITAKSVSVMVTTNLSVDLDTNPIYQILKTWPNVSWMISFDNANKEKFEYVRHGASWDMFYNNIDKLQRDRQTIQAHPAYSVYCALELEAYYDFCYSHALSIFWCDLVNPPALDIRRHNVTLRNLAAEQIDTVISRYEGKMDGTFDTLRRYKQQVIDPSYQRPMSSQTTDLKTFNANTEHILGKTHRFQDLWPEIHTLL